MSDTIYEDYFQRIAKTLLEATKDCRESMHEPDEQDLTVAFSGGEFDNAGTDNEVHVILRKGDFSSDQTETSLNLASLIALARLGARKVIEMNETPRDGSVAALRKWLEPKNGNDTLWIRETLATRGRDYKLGPLPEHPPMGVTIYIERDHSMDRPKKTKKEDGV